MSNPNPFEDPDRWGIMFPIARLATWIPPIAIWLAFVTFFAIGGCAFLFSAERGVATATILFAVSLLLACSFPVGFRTARNEGASSDLAMAQGFRTFLSCCAGLFNVGILVGACVLVYRFLAAALG